MLKTLRFRPFFRVYAALALVAATVAVMALSAGSVDALPPRSDPGGGSGCFNCTVSSCCNLTSANGGSECTALLDPTTGTCSGCQTYGRCEFLCC
jgi:hypothetical protein